MAKIAAMRIDKFLNVVNITKRRSVSEDMCKSGVVVKPAKDVKVGDKITIKFITREVNYEVLAIPEGKSIPKSAQGEYARQI